MYLIYTDEAGTSAREPVTVVAAVLVNADSHWRKAAEWMAGAIDEFVPEDLRDGYQFHAKDLYSGFKERKNDWPIGRRAEFTAAVASIPRMIQAAVVVSSVRRSAQEAGSGMAHADFQHGYAFGRCMARSDKYVRDWGGQDEVAVVIAEDVPEKRALLRASLKVPWEDLELSDRFLRPTAEEVAEGSIRQTNTGQVSRIVDTVHFVGKGQAPLMQIADACAFTFRRFLSDLPHSEELIEALLGRVPNRRDWDGPASNVSFDFDADHIAQRAGARD